MSDIKLFQLQNGTAQELAGSSIDIERKLQRLIEANLEVFLGVRFLATEYVTGKVHKGRIDTLGIDENGSPVIIEYKRAMNVNVILQGLFYLKWLMDHKGDFVELVRKQLNEKIAEAVDWNAPRVLCIASDFNRYDESTVQDINKNIELIRYKRFGNDLLLFELVNATTAQSQEVSVSPKAVEGNGKQRGGGDKTANEYFGQASPELRDRFEALKTFLLALGDDVQFKELKHYFAFRRIRNFVTVEVQPQPRRLRLSVNIDPDTLQLEQGFTRDLRGIGHLGTGNLEISIRSDADLERAKPLLLQSYQSS